MADKLTQNVTYTTLKESFEKNGFAESIACIQGFILGMLGQGFTSGDREILKYTIELLNDGEPLSGNAIASFTTLLIEMERELNAKKVQFYVPTAEDNVAKKAKKDFNAERLKCLADFAYGLSLGYNLTPQGPLQDKDLSSEQRDDLVMLENIFQIDVVSEVDEDDLMEVQNYLHSIIYRIWDKSHGAAKA